MSQSIQKRGEALKVFSGGGVAGFEKMGRLQLITALREGLNPWSKVLDIGCGALRGGYWFIHFLAPDCYFGIEPNREMLAEGIERILEPGLVDEKRPRFDHNSDFDTSVFGEKFDFFIARSVWTHASKDQIGTMLDGFASETTENGVFLTSYLPSGLFKHRDYQGRGWIGRSHESSEGGYVYHSPKWIAAECEARGLSMRSLRDDYSNGQVWLRIEQAHPNRRPRNPRVALLIES
jgi:SAM-dependent methyltransferase